MRFLRFISISLFLLLQFPLSKAQTVVINEIMQSNVDGLMRKQDFPDSWIELYNAGSRAVNLKGWRLGLTNDIEQAWTFRNSLTLMGKSYQMVYCNQEDNGYYQTDFHLDAKKCTIYLWDAEGTLVDTLAHKKQPAPNVAFGRTTDGGPVWDYEVTPTPGEANAGVFTRQMLPDPVFSIPGQVFTAGETSSVTVDISFPDEADLGKNEALPADTRLYITTDGSAPTANSMSYGRNETCSLTLTETTVLRARFLSAEALTALPVTHSYIFHPRALSLPVFSFSTNSEFLYDPEIGMLLGTDYSGNCYKGWRRPFNVEYFEPTAFDSAVFSQVCEAGMHGAGSLSHKQKAMNVYTNKRWQKKRFNSSTFWPDKPEITETKTFCVRNGGSRCLDSRFEDAFAQKLFASHIDSLQYLEYRPCVVYINGAYRGLYGLRERANHTWAENNRNIPEDVAVEIESFYDTGEAYAPVKALIDSESKDYAAWCQLMDIPLLLDYLCCQAFATNTLFPHSNLNMWMDPTGEDKRIHPLLKDLDAMAETANSTNWYNFITLTGSEGQWAGAFEQRRIFVCLFNMPEFRNAFLDRMQTYLGDFCKPSVSIPMVNAMRAEIDSEVAATFAAIDEGATYADFAGRIEKLLIPYCQNRPMIHYQHLSARFGLGRVIPMTVQNFEKNPDAKAVRINEIALTEGDFEGACFADRDVLLSTGSMDYVWARTVFYQDGRSDYRLLGTPTVSYRPDPAEAADIQSVSFQLVKLSNASHDVCVFYGDNVVTCLNPYAENDVEIQVQGSHVSVISHANDEVRYVLTGSASDATFEITSDFPWNVVLDGVTLSNTQGTIISSRGNTSGTVTLSAGKNNVLNNVAQEADRQQPGGAIYSMGALTFDGDGHLTVNTSGKVGRCVATEKSLTVLDGMYDLVNKSKGLKEYGSIWASQAVYSRGDMALNGGDYHITVSNAGAQGVIVGGELIIGDEMHPEAGPTIEAKVTATTMYVASDNGTLTSGCPAFEAQGPVRIFGESRITASAIDNASNAIKSFTSIDVYGGRHDFSCYDDCINCPGPIAFYGGTTVCSSTDDDAIDSDYPYPGAIRLAGGNLFTYTIAPGVEEGLDCDDDRRIFVSGGIVVSAGGTQNADGRELGGATQGFYMGPGIADCDAKYYYSLCDAEGQVICTYRFSQSFDNRFSILTAPTLGHGEFSIVYGTEPPVDYTEAVGDRFWIGGTTPNTQKYSFQATNEHATTMALLGASITVKPESHVIKDYWAETLDLDVRDYGIGGAGIALSTQPGYGLHEEVDDVCIEGRPDYDLYLIWCPSNDFQKSATLQSVTEGLDYVLGRIRQKDPDARIGLLTTLPIFSKGSEGYDADASGALSMRRYVEAQIAWSQRNDVPYLDLFHTCGFTVNNFRPYFVSDNTHLSEAGYDQLKEKTADFLSKLLAGTDAITQVHRDSQLLLDSPYSLMGIRMNHMQPGICILRDAEGQPHKIFIK